MKEADPVPFVLCDCGAFSIGGSRLGFELASMLIWNRLEDWLMLFLFRSLVEILCFIDLDEFDLRLEGNLDVFKLYVRELLCSASVSLILPPPRMI